MDPFIADMSFTAPISLTTVSIPAPLNQTHFVFSMPDPSPSDLSLSCEQLLALATADLEAAIRRYFGSHGVSSAALSDATTGMRISSLAYMLQYECLVQAMASQATQLRSEAQQLQMQASNLSSQLSHATSSLADANHQVASLQAQHVADQSQIADLQRQLSQTQTQLSQVQTPQQAQDTIAQLNRQLADAQNAAKLAASSHGPMVVAGIVGIIGGFAAGRSHR